MYYHRALRASPLLVLHLPPLPLPRLTSIVLNIQANIEFVPPYGSQGALYLRPLLFGTGARIGLQPSDEYTLLVMAIPVGNYYKVRWNVVC